ncbi:MAG TPA: alpha/beta fold hydrolase [Nevskiaceae bacterium]|nr:alpha/beta fold hydrolase [Nevskiaceae bacterium]
MPDSAPPSVPRPLAADIPRFEPHGALCNSFLQTTLAARRPYRHDTSGMQAVATSEVLNCGAGVRLAASLSRHPQARSIAVLIHGWEGSQDSVYLHNLACALYTAGHSVLRLNLRDHGGSHALNELPFHSARIAEVIGACRAAQALVPGVPLICIGYSLGGNFALRIGLYGPEHSLHPALCVGVSPAIDPRATVEAIDAHPIYRHYFLRKWRADLFNKIAAWPGCYDGFRHLAQHDHFVSATEEFAERFTEFRDGGAYLQAYTLAPAQLLESPTPLAILTAQDDPVIPFAGFSELHEGTGIRALLTPLHGGHCGFIRNWSLDCWSEEAVVQLAGRVAEGRL